MKTLFKILFVSLLLINFGCSDDDKLPVDFEDLNASGVPFASEISSAATGLSDINLLDPTGSNFSKTYEIISPQGGTDVTKIEVFANATRLSAILAAEQLLFTVNSDQFDLTSGPYPQVTVNYVATDILNVLGLTTSDLEGGDQVNFRLALTNANGTYTDVSANFDNQSASHTFISNVICLNVPIPGDWLLEMEDLFGDGWNGGKITVNIEGVETVYAAEGFGTGGTPIVINIPDGTTIFTWTYSAGDWEGENLYTLTDPNGTVVLDEGVGDGSQGNGPRVGELLNVCP